MTPARRRSPAQQPGRAQRRGGFGGLSRLRKLHDARKPKEPSAAERGVRGSPPTSKTRRSPSFKRRQAQRPGRAQRRGGSGVSPDCENYMTPTRRRSRAQRPGRAQRRGGFGGLPRLRKLHDAHAPKEPSAAERGVRGIPRLRQHSTLTCQEEPSAATRHHAPEDRPPPSAHYLVSLGESKGVYTHVCFSGEAKRRKLCLDFPRTGPGGAREKSLISNNSGL
jgi:hypothetical protein